MKYVYFDNAATTEVAPEVMTEINNASFFNASALYPPSVSIKNEIEKSRKIIMNKLGARDGELVFTSGATESNNQVIFGKITDKRHHALVLEGEHSSVYQPAKYLKDNGYDVDFIPVLKNGMCDLTALNALVRKDTTLLVFGLVNSDTGTIQDAHSIVKAIRAVSKDTHIHIDATQAFCKLPINVSDLDINSMAISAHKIHGPKGIGALWLHSNAKVPPLMLGGGQQPLRAGTENNPGIIGFGKAVEIFDTDKNWAYTSQLHTRLISGLSAKLPTAKIVGINNNPYITNIQLPAMGQTVMNALGDLPVPIYVGLGSACTGTGKNRTLSAMGVPENLARRSIRVSFNPKNTFDEVDIFLDNLAKVCDSI